MYKKHEREIMLYEVLSECAQSDKAWLSYGWCSEFLFADSFIWGQYRNIPTPSFQSWVVRTKPTLQRTYSNHLHLYSMILGRSTIKILALPIIWRSDDIFALWTWPLTSWLWTSEVHRVVGDQRQALIKDYTKCEKNRSAELLTS